MAANIDAMLDSGVATGLKIVKAGVKTLTDAVNYEFDPVPGDQRSEIPVYITRGGPVTDVVPAPTPPPAGDIDSDPVLIRCDRWKEATFSLTDAQMATINPMKVRKMVEQKARDLVSYVSSDVLTIAKNGLSLSVGTVGTRPFQSNLATAVAGISALNQRNVPNEDRAVVLSVASYGDAILLDAISGFDKSGDQGPINDMIIGRKFGANWWYDTRLPNHVAGAAAGYVVAATPVGSTTTAISGGTGAFNVGDIFRVAGINRSFVVLAGTTNTVLNFSPRTEEAWAANAAITKTASHNTDLILQKEAVAFVHRPQADMSESSGKGGSYDVQMVDPESGLALRYQISREHYQWRHSLSMMYGAQVVRPDFGVRIVS